ncbi:DinB family protein [Flavobacterium sp.]|uniref:DinB family protein n=1 Tax=Flavobacterium sp. TaxID=239 RepID=UPI00286A69A5|nr:DinB family protein [Flavobacterium sp.]
MNEKKAVNALLGEYRNVVTALQHVIVNVSYANLTTVVDANTTNPDCQSIQTILTHIVSSGYSYAGYIRKLKKINDNRPGKVLRMTVIEYRDDLENLIAYTNETFETIEDDELEEFDEDKKIKTTWGQVYDIEQMMEHAIVHVLRHRRQIEKFKRKLEI